MAEQAVCQVVILGHRISIRKDHAHHHCAQHRLCSWYAVENILLSSVDLVLRTLLEIALTSVLVSNRIGTPRVTEPKQNQAKGHGSGRALAGK